MNRAYTFGPAVYPDTPVHASMGTASVSKSLTATAVVREVDIQGRSLNDPFAGMIGVVPDYFLETPLGPFKTLTVRVRDVLDNQGGFAGTPKSYGSHALIVAAGATAPVDGEELFKYVFASPPDGHVGLGAMQDDTYWQPEWFMQDRLMGTMRYSNAGYSLAGELVRVQSGVPYNEYVVSKLLAPFGLEDRIYPFPGARVRTHGPTRALFGKYLVDTRHPYNIASPNPPQSVQPAVGLAANPVERWRPYMGPVEPRAPTHATTLYGGDFHLGGAPLAAGGWWADGEALGRLIRSISRTDTLVGQDVAAWMWHPALWNFNHNQAAGWAYVHGWYVRGNWVGWMGGDEGAVALVVHNRMYDVTVVFLANGLDSPSNFINPLMASPNQVQGFSQIGQVWPCTSDPSFGPNFTGCQLPVPAVY